MIRFRKDTPRYWFMSNYYSCEFVMNGIRYQTKAGKAHGFNRGMIGRTLELLWEKFQNNSFLYIFMCL